MGLGQDRNWLRIDHVRLDQVRPRAGPGAAPRGNSGVGPGGFGHNGRMAEISDKPLVDPAPVLRGHGLRLRLWDLESDADLAAWLRGRTDPEFLRWNTPLVREQEPADARESLASHLDTAKGGMGMPFCVTDEATGATLGHVGIGVLSRPMRSGPGGYWVLPEA